MNVNRSFKNGLAAMALAGSALIPGIASAQTPATWTPGKWYFGAEVYAYLPSVGGSLAFPAPTGGTSVNVDAATIIDNLKMTFMGAFAAHNGRWGFFTDVLYLDVGGDKSNTRDFSISGAPSSTTADLNLDLKGTIWTAAGMYRVYADRALTADVIGGFRMFSVKPELDYSFSTTLPNFPGRDGSREFRQTVWDAIIGLRGRYTFGERREWFVPYYVDIGTGGSDLTWQAMAGIGYSYQAWDFTAAWRYLDYNFDSGDKIKDMNFSGPMLGVVYRW